MDIEAAITELVKGKRVQVPPFPAAAIELSKLVAAADFELAQLVRVVKGDPTLAAAVLGRANAAAYLRAEPVTDLGKAVQRLGARELRALALAAGLVGCAAAPGPLATLRRRAWLEALCSARVCEVLAPEPEKETAFVAGLLHDFGRLLTIACLEGVLGRDPSANVRTEEGWWALVERFHLELGLVLAAQWGLPQELERVIAGHHEVDLGGDPLLERVALSDEVVRLLDARLGLTPEELGTVGGLSGEQCAHLAAAIEELPAFVASFEFPGGADGPSRVAAPGAPVAALAGPAVLLQGASAQPAQCQVMAFTEDKVSVRLPCPVKSNVLARLVLPSGLVLCVRVHAWEVGGAWFALLSPFAAPAEQRRQWREFGKSLGGPAAQAIDGGGAAELSGARRLV